MSVIRRGDISLRIVLRDLGWRLAFREARAQLRNRGPVAHGELVRRDGGPWRVENVRRVQR